MTETLFSHDPHAVEKLIKKVITEFRNAETVLSDLGLPNEDRLSQKQAAKLIGVSITTIVKWRKNGTIPGYKVGRVIFYSRKELISVMRDKKNVATN